MEFRIADTFTAALTKLSRDEQKAVKTSVFDLQTNPVSNGLQMHRIDASKDPNFWSVRVNRDIRIIVHRTANSFLLAYVDHHEEAYQWAARRRIEAHPTTGAIQIVEVRERVEVIADARARQQQFDFGDGVQTLLLKPEQTQKPVQPFRSLSTDQLLSVGVPEDWLEDVLTADEEQFLDLAAHLPSEASEALLEYATTGVLHPSALVEITDPFKHPDSLRRFRVVENVEELEQALNFPWEKWIVFLHPSQRETVEREYSGPARISGSAGTGKTVVALHRAARLAARDPNRRVLLTTFSDPLASALERKLSILAEGKSEVVPRVTVGSFIGIATELYQLGFAQKPMTAKEELVRSMLTKAAAANSVPASDRSLFSEWMHIVDAWQIENAEEYATVPRLGRKSRMGTKQRDRFWPVFEMVKRQLAEKGLTTAPGIFRAVAKFYEDKSEKPFSNIVVDEAQDLGVAELRFLAAIAPDAPDALFFTGDLGQRIFQQPFSWKSFGVNVQGRSSVLRVNYRTSHQIRGAADRLMPASVSDIDGHNDRRGTVSVFNGPEPAIILAGSWDLERDAVVRFVKEAIASGIKPEEIGVFVRSRENISRAREAVKAAHNEPFELNLHKEGPEGFVRIGVMHLAKGLEFKAVAVICCNEDELPLKARIDTPADEVELDDVFATERQLLYVACTRARDLLLVSGLKPGSQFLGDMVPG